MLEAVRTARGVARSLLLYHGNSRRRAALHHFYARFVSPGQLVFDVGAHVGDRVATFRRLGARVVAIEPQPALAKTLRILFGLDNGVVVEQLALGPHNGTIELQLNIDNPTISTVSSAFVHAARNAPGWQGQRWTKAVSANMTTLDALVTRHGMPSFIKIDVEGFESEVLTGLSRASAALSFEFTTIMRDVAKICVERCALLGYARFNAVVGESLSFVHQEGQSAGQITRWLEQLPVEANSGDVYAMLP
jgi:FkbM family methyltransferase